MSEMRKYMDLVEGKGFEMQKPFGNQVKADKVFKDYKLDTKEKAGNTKSAMNGTYRELKTDVKMHLKESADDLEDGLQDKKQTLFGDESLNEDSDEIPFVSKDDERFQIDFGSNPDMFDGIDDVIAFIPLDKRASFEYDRQKGFPGWDQKWERYIPEQWYEVGAYDDEVNESTNDIGKDPVYDRNYDKGFEDGVNAVLRGDPKEEQPGAHKGYADGYFDGYDAEFGEDEVNESLNEDSDFGSEEEYNDYVYGRDYDKANDFVDRKKLSPRSKKMSKEFGSTYSEYKMKQQNKRRPFKEEKTYSDVEREEMKELGMDADSYEQLKAFDLPKQDYMVRNHPDYNPKTGKIGGEDVEENINRPKFQSVDTESVRHGNPAQNTETIYSESRLPSIKDAINEKFKEIKKGLKEKTLSKEDCIGMLMLEGIGSQRAEKVIKLAEYQIKDYYKVGKTFNVGNGPHDKMKKVKSVKILESNEDITPAISFLKRVKNNEMTMKDMAVTLKFESMGYIEIKNDKVYLTPKGEKAIKDFK